MDEKGATQFCQAIGGGGVATARAMPANFLIVLRGGTPGAMIPLPPEAELAIGRAAENDLQLIDPGLSRHHARVAIAADGTATLADLGSTNGTFLNGARLFPREPAPLRDGDRLRLGPVVVVKFAQPDPCEERYQRELFERSVRDPLTGLYNRGYFLEQLGPTAARGAREGHGLGVMLLDLDHFKAVNDRHGHEAGDEVLRATAAVLRGATRPDDLVARLGGEEFVIALPVAAPDLATARAERVRRALARREIAFEEKTLRVTCSIGLTFAPPFATRTATELLEAADRGLYRAKAAGRNRVVIAGDRVAPGETAAVGGLTQADVEVDGLSEGDESAQADTHRPAVAPPGDA